MLLALCACCVLRVAGAGLVHWLLSDGPLAKIGGDLEQRTEIHLVKDGRAMMQRRARIPVRKDGDWVF